MPVIDWGEELEVGHAEIDADHRAMVAMVKRVHAAGERGDHAEAMTALRELGSFTRDHFAREEALMDSSRYEMAARHRKEHQSLFDEIGAQIEEFHAGRSSVAAIVTFIRIWLLGHVAASDRPLGRALARGVRR